MTKQEALEALRNLDRSDAEVAHSAADDILLALIGDEEIEAAYEAVPKLVRMRCPSCRGAFPEGCSTCRPLCGRDTCKNRGHQPIVRASSLSALVGSAANHRYRTEAAWKRDAFTPTPEVM